MPRWLQSRISKPPQQRLTRYKGFGHPVEPNADPEGIFIVGCHRSGTTLLRYLMDSHPLLACPPESKFIAGLKAFLEYPQVVSGLHSLGLNDRDIRRLLLRLIQEVLTEYASQQSKARWVDKTPNYAPILPFIDDLFERRAKYIIILRHPFDAALSLYGAFKSLRADDTDAGHVSVKSQTSECLSLWLQHCRTVDEDPDLLSAISRFGNSLSGWMQFWREINEDLIGFSEANSARCHLLRYEDLVKTPEREVSRILDFLALKRLPGDAGKMCSTAFKIHHTDGFQDHKIHATSRIHATSVNRWSNWLPEEIEAGWAIVGQVARAVGYNCEVNPLRGKVSVENKWESPDAFPSKS
jgi:protein-tyrosine sulfotransferase